MFQSQVRSKLAFGPCSLLTSRLSELQLIDETHSISTLSFSHYKYNEWFCKVEIWIHHSQPMPHHGFWVVGWWRFWLKYPRFHTKMECVWIDPTSSQHLNPSNFSLWVWWIVGQGGCWKRGQTTFPPPPPPVTGKQVVVTILEPTEQSPPYPTIQHTYKEMLEGLRCC